MRVPLVVVNEADVFSPFILFRHGATPGEDTVGGNTVRYLTPKRHL
jgi:hypothetical protein